MAELVIGPTESDILALVSVQQLRAAKRVTSTREDDFIKDCILDAWSWIDGPQGKCRAPILPQQWRFTVPACSALRWRASVARARSIQAASYIDQVGASQTLSSNAYAIIRDRDAIGADLSITLPTGSSLAARGDAVSFTVDAGWPDAATLPRVFRRALLLLAAHYFDNREATFADTRVTQVSRKIEFGVDELIGRYVVPIDYSGRL